MLRKKKSKTTSFLWESTDKSIFEDYLCKDLSGTSINSHHHCVDSVGGIFKSDFWSLKSNRCVDLNYEYEMVVKESTSPEILLSKSDIDGLQNLFKNLFETIEDNNSDKLSVLEIVDMLNLWKGRLSYNLVYDDFGILQEAIIYFESLLNSYVKSIGGEPKLISEKGIIQRQPSCHPSVLFSSKSNNGTVV